MSRQQHTASSGGQPRRDELPLVLIAAPEDMHPQMCWLAHQSGLRSIVVHSGEAVLGTVFRYRPALLVVSAHLPGLNAWEVVRQVRAMTDMPISVVEREFRTDHAARAFALLADAYVTSPVHRETVMPHISALLWRARPVPEATNLVTDGWLYLDLLSREALVEGHPLRLTALEFDLLGTLAGRPRQVFSPQQLLRSAWGEESGGDIGRVKYVVHHLRRKLRQATGHEAPIETVRAVGYRYVPPPAGQE